MQATELLKWAEKAKHRQTVAYYEGALAFDRGNSDARDLADAAQYLIDAGLITVTHRLLRAESEKNPDRRIYEYTAIRTNAEWH